MNGIRWNMKAYVGIRTMVPWQYFLLLHDVLEHYENSSRMTFRGMSMCPDGVGHCGPDGPSGAGFHGAPEHHSKSKILWSISQRQKARSVILLLN